MRVTYDNFRTISTKYLKYASNIAGKVRLSIIDNERFKAELQQKYRVAELREFFYAFPHALYTVDDEERDLAIMTRTEIGFFSFFALIRHSDHEYVLFDVENEIAQSMAFINKVESQPVLFEEFVKLALDDFIDMSTGDLLFHVEYNLRLKGEEADDDEEDE